MLEGFYFKKRTILGILTDVFGLTFEAVTKTSKNLGKQHVKIFSQEQRKVLETFVFRLEDLLTEYSIVSTGGLWAEPHLGSVHRWLHGVGIWRWRLW